MLRVSVAFAEEGVLAHGSLAYYSIALSSHVLPDDWRNLCADAEAISLPESIMHPATEFRMPCQSYSTTSAPTLASSKQKATVRFHARSCSRRP